MKKLFLLVTFLILLSSNVFAQLGSGGTAFLTVPDTTNISKTTGDFYIFGVNYYVGDGTYLKRFILQDGDTLRISSPVIMTGTLYVDSIIETDGRLEFSPRWSDVVYSASGTGLMNDTSGTYTDRYFFYSWRSVAGTLQTGTIEKKIKFPDYFYQFDAATTDSAIVIDFMTQSTDAAECKFDVTIYDYDDPGTTITQTAIVGVAGLTVYSQKAANATVDFSGARAVLASMTSNKTLVIQIDMYSKDSKAVYISNINVNW